MKMFRHISVLLLALLLAGFSAMASAKTIRIDVNGLVCAFCAQGIEKTLKTFPETQAVYVNLEHHLVAVQLKGDSDIDDAALRKAITDAGYAVVGIQRTDESLDAIRAKAKQGE
jgi:copper chaperone CopZ